MTRTRKPSTRSLTPLALAAVLGLVPLAGASAQSYSLQMLGVPSGATFSQGLGLNSSGEVAGLSDIGGDQQAVVSAGGMLSQISLPGSQYSLGEAINDSGQVTGEAQLYTPAGQSSVTEAYVYDRGNTTYLASLGGGFSQGNAINNSGQVAGGGETATGSTHAFLYSNGVVNDLDPIIGGYDDTTAYGLSSNGLVTGTVYGDYTFIYNSKAPVQTTDGAVSFLPSLTDPTGGSGIIGEAINDSSQVTGYSYAANNQMHAFVFSNGTVTDLTPNLPDNATSEGKAINSKGQIVGIETPGGFGVNSFGFLYSNGQLVDINTLIAPTPGFDLLAATGINDSGQITGYGFVPATAGDRAHLEAYLLTPNAAPEPSQFAALGLGVLGLAALGWKARRRGAGSAS